MTDVAAVLAVALNKFPNTVVTIREGARALDPGLEEMATVFAMPWQTRIQHVVLPQLAPYIAAATRAGLSLVWKIVLVVELMGRSNGVGFEIGNAFQLFDVALLLAYALPFVAIMLAIETFLVQPLEQSCLPLATQSSLKSSSSARPSAPRRARCARCCATSR